MQTPFFRGVGPYGGKGGLSLKMNRTVGRVLIEREKEVLALIALTQRVRGGRGHIVLVSGEAGIGKTSLLNAVRERSGDGFRWGFGACDALFTPRPLGPIEDMTGILGPDVAAMLKAGSAPHDLYPTILKALEDPGDPFVLVWEDLHWADHATLDLLKFLGRRIALLNVLIVASFRADETGADHPLYSVLGDLQSNALTRIDLKPLSRAAVEQLADTAGMPGAWLFEATAGNPFLVREMLAARASAGAGVPASVRDAVASRHSRLSPPMRRFLEQISVIPVAVSRDLAQALATDSPADLIDDAVARGILITSERGDLRFRHELARLATLDRIPATRSRENHARVFCVLADMDGAAMLDQMVHHAAGAFDAQAVLRVAPAAAEKAARAGAHREAASHLATALRFVEDAEPELAATLHERWAYESSLAARIDDDVLDARRHAITLWRALGRNDKVGENLRWLSRLHWYRGEAAEAMRLADQAIRVLEAVPPSAEQGMAYSLRSQLHMLNDKMDEAVEWGNRALDIERQFPDPALRAHALNNVGTAMVFRGRTDGQQLLEESLAISLANGLHEHAARAYTNLSEYAVEFRQFALAERVLSEGIAFDTEHDLDAWTYYLSGRLAQMRLDQGRLKDAERIARSVLDREKLTLLMRLPALKVLATARMRMDEEDAHRLIDQAWTDAIATDELQHVVPLRLIQIEAAWLRDEPADAAPHLDALLKLDTADRHPWNIGERAVWARRFGIASAAAIPNDLPAPFMHELSGNLDDAAEAWDRLGMTYQASLVRLQSEGQEPLARAIRDLDTLGAHAAVVKARRKAALLGFKKLMPRSRRGAYKAARAHPFGLTRREQDVLALIVKGQSNREIGESLGMATRTAEHHVSAVLGKLNASNRMALILRVQTDPWLLEGP